MVESMPAAIFRSYQISNAITRNQGSKHCHRLTACQSCVGIFGLDSISNRAAVPRLIGPTVPETLCARVMDQNTG
jgi:hypothetical protein